MIRRLKVGLAFQKDKTMPVGEMLRTETGVIYFQYDAKFLQSSLSLSPIKLKGNPEPQTPSATDSALFDGLFGVFSDSLPDGWGLLMMNRAMKKFGLDFASSSGLDRLSFVGQRGMGALVYEPANDYPSKIDATPDLARLADEAGLVLDGKSDDVLSELMVLGGSPGGARPKVLVGVENNAEYPRVIAGVDDLPDNFEHWIIKFKGKDEREDAGIIEYIYAQTARKVGLKMSETQLFSDKRGRKWFGAKRFDRIANRSRFHMHSAAGLAHANFRLPSLDYEDLLKITRALTRREDDLMAMFRLAVFNVIFHNRDDHAKNFAFLMSESGDWRLAPAFDLTWSAGPGGEHSTAVLGEGRMPGFAHLMALAQKQGLNRKRAQEIMFEVEEGKSFMLKLMQQFEVKTHPLTQILKKKTY